VKLRVDLPAAERVAELRRRMYSPFCGFVTSTGYTLRPRGAARAFVAGASLCGVHVLTGQPEPGGGGYHIGGMGFVPFEPEIRVYAEAAERYSAALAGTDPRWETRWASHQQMIADGLPTVHAEYLDVQPPDRLGPFNAFDPRAPLTWLRCPKVDGGVLWAPEHMLFMGYHVRRSDGEPWLQSAFSTGTAAHTQTDRAIEAALLELIQIDATMGHWYGSAPATRILLDARTERLSGLIRRYLAADADLLTFYQLHSADLPGFTVACLRQTPDRSVPATAVGLGADLVLERAMYKALGEVLGVCSLAEWAYLKTTVDSSQLTPVATMYDVDSNVTYYAAHDADVVTAHFGGGPAAAASDLAPDPGGTDSAGADPVEVLTKAFPDTGKTLVAFDITPGDIAALGLVVVRLWCPEILSLNYPSAPPSRHPRFEAYGGFGSADPHPYP
jgi:thiazole/oxazole-forming peptide maturase SagD family component